jgi:ATP-binding cassette subfamily B protein
MPAERHWREALWDRAVLVQAMGQASPGLCGVTVAVTVASGILPPAFNIASGLAVAATQTTVAAGDDSMRRILPPLLAATVLYLVMHVLGPVREMLASALMRRVDARLTVDAMRAVSRPRGVAHLEDRDVLDRIAQAQGVVTATTPGTGVYRLVRVWSQRLQGGLSLVLLVGFSPLVTVVLLAGHVLAYRWRRWHWHEVTSVVWARTQDLRRAEYVRRLAVEPHAAKEARVFSLAGWLRQRYRQEFLAVMEDIWRSRRNGGPVAVAVTAVLLGLEGGVLVLIARSAVQGDIGLGLALVYAQSVVASSSLGQFDQAHAFVTDGAEALRTLRALERAVPDAAASLGGTRPAEDRPSSVIRFEDVSFRYPGQAEAVYEGLDLEIEAGRSLAVVGQNGAGKTTLVKLLARLHDPTAGRITVDGIDLAELDPESWQRRVTAIFQDFVRYKLSAADNVAFGALHAERSRDALDWAAGLAGADRIVDGLPDGWDTVLSREFGGGVDLSGGEWQRIALARAIYAVRAGAGVLILDEPTAALDVRGEADIYDRFLEVTSGLTTIVVSHRFSTVRRADRIVVIEHGRVVEDGTHDSLVAAGGRYSTMYDLQASRYRDRTA